MNNKNSVLAHLKNGDSSTVTEIQAGTGLSSTAVLDGLAYLVNEDRVAALSLATVVGSIRFGIAIRQRSWFSLFERVYRFFGLGRKQ